MQAATDPIVIQEAAGRDDLGLDREVSRAFYLAEIRGTARAHQGLEPLLPAGAHDLDLQVPAAGGAPGVICGPARRHGARIFGLEHREAPKRLRQASAHDSTILHHQKPVTSEAAQLLGLVSAARCPPQEPMGGALCHRTFAPKVAAADMERRVDVELPVVLPDLRERDMLGVPEQPGCLVVE